MHVWRLSLYCYTWRWLYIFNRHNKVTWKHFIATVCNVEDASAVKNKKQVHISVKAEVVKKLSSKKGKNVWALFDTVGFLPITYVFCVVGK